MPLSLYSDSSDSPPPNPWAAVKYIVAIAAGKGGVGKSSVAVNLGLALRSQGFQVGIMDADVYGPSIRHMLPEDHLPMQEGACLYPALCKGIKVISIAYFHKPKEAAAVRAPIANRVITHFIKNVCWGDLDVLLVDFPPGTGDIQLTLCQHMRLTGAILITTPQEVALLDVRKALSLFEQVKVPILGILENMSYYLLPQFQEERVYLFGRGGGERLARETGYPLLGEIPLDPLVCSCGDQGHSLFNVDWDRQRPVTHAFDEAARHVLTQIAFLQTNTEGIGVFELKWQDMVS
jgi:ATP-binding protein involved in chromosome partitioning